MKSIILILFLNSSIYAGDKGVKSIAEIQKAVGIATVATFSFMGVTWGLQRAICTACTIPLRSSPFRKDICMAVDLPNEANMNACLAVWPWCRSYQEYAAPSKFCTIGNYENIAFESLNKLNLVLLALSTFIKPSEANPGDSPPETDPDPDPDPQPARCEELVANSEEQTRCYCEANGFVWVGGTEEPCIDEVVILEEEEETIAASFTSSSNASEEEKESSSSASSNAASSLAAGSGGISKRNSKKHSSSSYKSVKDALTALKTKLNNLSNNELNSATVNANSKSGSSSIKNSKQRNKIAKSTDDIFAQISTRYNNYQVALDMIQK